MIAMMKDKYGLSYGDIYGLLKDGFGIPVTRGGAAHAVLRAGKRARPVYEVLEQLVRRSRAVYPDESGWKVGGLLQWMWAFVTDRVTIYYADTNHLNRYYSVCLPIRDDETTDVFTCYVSE